MWKTRMDIPQIRAEHLTDDVILEYSIVCLLGYEAELFSNNINLSIK
jgi:hypothetical protein